MWISPATWPRASRLNKLCRQLVALTTLCRQLLYQRTRRSQYFFLIATPSLKCLHMALGLLAIQLTYHISSDKLLSLLSLAIFLAGLHNVLTHGTLAKLWESQRLNRGDYVFGLLTACALSALATVASEKRLEVMTFTGITFYIIFKYLERLSFNRLISIRKPLHGYLLLIIGSSLEILVYISLFSKIDHILARFVLPAGVLSLALAYIFAYLGKISKDCTIQTARINHRDMLFYSFYSFFLLAVVMADRAIGNIFDNLSFLSGRYLVIFSYASAIYALLVSILETRRPDLYEVARKSTNLYNYLVHRKSRPYFVISLCILPLSLCVPTVCTMITTLTGHQLLTIQDMLIFSRLLVFYSIIFTIIYIHNFFLCNQYYYPLAITWTIAAFARSFTFSAVNIHNYLDLLLLSSLAILATLLLFLKNNKNDKSISTINCK
jgi:hypothetical protein